MKRFLAILMVMFLLLGSVASSEDNDSNETLKTLQLFSSVYKTSPEMFTGHRVVATYLAFQTFVTDNNYVTYNNYETLYKGVPGTMLNDLLITEKGLMKAHYNMMHDVDVFWVKWLDDEISDAECMEGMMKKIDKIIEVYNELNQE